MNGADQAKHPETGTGFQGCPVLGVGLGLRRSLFKDTIRAADTGLLDFIEITPENYMRRGGKRRAMLVEAASKFPLVSHGVSMSIGSTDPWDEHYLRDLEAVFEIANPPWFSDHLCFSSVDGVYFNDLIPLPRTKETVSHVVSRLKFLQDRFQKPVLIENISQYFNYPADEMNDAEFIARILEGADCGLLLDVNNVYVNAENHGFDPKTFLNALPLQRVVQIHVAGHHKGSLCLIDTHGAPVCDPVWELLAWVMSRPACRPCGVMVERDNDIPAFSELLPELLKIRAIWEQTGQPSRHPKRQVAHA